MPRVNVKDKRKQQLIDANMQSIAKRGLNDTTITHVSGIADMSRGIVNFYFTSKEKMMQETLAFLMAEQTSCWQEALAASKTEDPLARAEIILRTLMGDKLCSARRMACLSAFIGHAGTHTGYAKLIRAADKAIVKQLKALFQQVGMDGKQAESRAKETLAFIRGHHVLAFLNPEWGKPSSFCDQWMNLLHSWAGSAPAAAVKPVLHVVPAKAKKPAPRAVLPGQMDFGDLFSQN